jgi:hypothetical protein
MIFRVLIKFNQNLSKKQDFKEHKLLTIRLLIIIKDQPITLAAFLLTARQYGEVVLPDAASGHGTDSLARKQSRCKEGMAHFLPSEYKFY